MKPLAPSLGERKQALVTYLLVKVAEEDWHGVADAAMDLRELAVEARLAQLPLPPGGGGRS